MLTVMGSNMIKNNGANRLISRKTPQAISIPYTVSNRYPDLDIMTKKSLAVLLLIGMGGRNLR